MLRTSALLCTTALAFCLTVVPAQRPQPGLAGAAQPPVAGGCALCRHLDGRPAAALAARSRRVARVVGWFPRGLARGRGPTPAVALVDGAGDDPLRPAAGDLAQIRRFTVLRILHRCAPNGERHGTPRNSTVKFHTVSFVRIRSGHHKINT